MTKFLELPKRFTEAVDRQCGAIGRSQWLAAGVSDAVVRRLVRNGDARRLGLGVVALTPESVMQNVWAGVLLGGEGAVVGGLAAAVLHGLLEVELPFIDVYTPLDREDHGPWRFPRAPREGVCKPPMTTLEQTFVDVAGTVTDDQMIGMLARADRKLQTGKLLELMAQQTRLAGRDQLRNRIADFDDGVRSVLEFRYMCQVERPHGLPVPVRQAQPLGRHACDVLYREYGLIVELDGRRYHDGLVASGDADRDAEHLQAGYVTLRFGWSRVTEEPCLVAARIADELKKRGWKGRRKRCKCCPSWL